MKRKFIPIIAVAVALAITTTAVAVENADDGKTYLSPEIQNDCLEVGLRYNVCPELLMAICERESGGHADARNGNCVGLMQVNENIHQDRMEELGVTDLTDPYENITVACDIIVELASENEDLYWVLDKYSGNSKADYNYEHGIQSAYAKWVVNRTAELERANGK